MSMKNKKEDGFTGLEAAIVLIAFVVVAAVFSYVVLGAGFFTTQKSQQVVHAGVTQAASNIVIKGNVYGLTQGAGTNIQWLQFDLGLAAGGLPVDVSKIQMVYSTASVPPTTLTYSGATTGDTAAGGDPVAASTWRIIGSSNRISPLIQEGQYFTAKAWVPTNLDPRTEFSLEIKPENGAALGIDRTVPAGITSTTLLF